MGINLDDEELANEMKNQLRLSDCANNKGIYNQMAYGSNIKHKLVDDSNEDSEDNIADESISNHKNQQRFSMQGSNNCFGHALLPTHGIKAMYSRRGGNSPTISPTTTILTPIAANGGSLSPITLASPTTSGDTGDSNPLQLILRKAGDVAEKVVLDYARIGDPDPASKATEVLKTALAMLGHPTDGLTVDEHPFLGVGGPHFAAPTMLAHPDEFKNPSSFLKIYGDPLCGNTLGNLGVNPSRHENGNWVCHRCSNVNFPRRFRCNKCNEYRDAVGDEIVAEYAKAVYRQHLRTYRNLAVRRIIAAPIKRMGDMPIAWSINNQGWNVDKGRCTIHTRQSKNMNTAFKMNRPNDN